MHTNILTSIRRPVFQIHIYGTYKYGVYNHMACGLSRIFLEKKRTGPGIEPRTFRIIKRRTMFDVSALKVRMASTFIMLTVRMLLRRLAACGWTQQTPEQALHDRSYFRNRPFLNPSGVRRTRWRSWLRHCATSRNVAGSIPDGVTGTFH